ncbi:structural maintenance of chromosomes protein 6-like isoform X2 [Leptotrombidium deliense]|uniref:Structural maintenance of chromosomes protein 6-like isoform X2 n=1 Tax=Leptotrombidium deliense TaxID=299467 RepID=A0A443SW93_9ACAR|nr:structural maintenance of chromosomes protein 6-like isoform X2 [Leptotrombidium deliense]
MSQNRHKRLRLSNSTEYDERGRNDQNVESEEESTEIGWADDLPDFDQMDVLPVPSQINESVCNFGDVTADCGTIEKVSLFNFMCHSNFKIKFGPRINFVQGANGSGKSAILTAVVVALGGRAHDTSRGQSIKSFIKTGESKGKVVLKLCNGNGDSSSYKYEEYGNSIIVERSFTIDGSSTYSLKSKQKRLISNKKEELDNIVRHFNIQITNPVVVLNQEISRNFLNSKNPRDKYNFFMRATQLELLRNNYASAQELSLKAKDQLNERKAALPQAKLEMETLDAKVKSFNMLCDQQRQLKHLMKELLWSLVINKEKEISELAQAIETKEIRMHQIRVNSDTLREESRNLINEKEQLKNSLLAFTGENEMLKAEVDEKKKEIITLKQQRQRLVMDVNKYESELKICDQDRIVLEKSIEKLQIQLCNENSLVNEKNKRLNRIKELEQFKSNTTNEVKSLQCEIQNRTSMYEELQESKKNLLSDVDHISAEIRRKKAEVHSLESSRNETLSRFGEHMPRLVKLIEEEYKKGAFKKKPLGPIGAYIKLQTPACALAVESCLKALILSFCCDNLQDEKTLRKLMQKVITGKHPNTVTRKFAKRHDVRGREVVHSEYQSFLQLIKIDEDAVANVLIDKARIETILFIPDNKKCTDLLSDPNTVPRNCRQAFTKEGTNMHPATANSCFRCYNNESFSKPRYLERNVEENIKDIKLAIGALEEALETRIKEKDVVLKKLAECQKECKDAEFQLKNLRRNLQNYDSELNILRSIEDPSSAEIAILEGELQSCVNKIGDVQKSLLDAKEKLIVADNEMKVAVDIISKKDAEYKAHLNNRHPLREKLNRINNDLDLKNNELSRLEQELLENARQQKKDETKRCGCKREADDLLRKAENECSRIETNKTPQELEKEIEERRSFLTQSESEIGQRDQIIEQLQKVKEHYNTLYSAVFGLDKYLADFEMSMHGRANAYIELRKFLSFHASYMFSIALDNVNFKGQLCIYHKNTEDKDTKKVHKAKTIEILVNPKVNNQSVVCSTKSLSGGERAYSTVGFILALWGSCHSPFRILDEFDCFMDMVTRRIALDTLIEAIKQKEGRQYIFLTPLVVDKYRDDDLLIKVHYMPEPERNCDY